MPRPSMLPFSVAVFALALAAGCQRPGVTRTAPGTGGSGGTAGAGGGVRMDAGFGFPGNRDGGPAGGPGTGPGTEDPGSSTVEPIEDCETAAKAAGNVGCTFYSVPFAFSYDSSLAGACHAMFVVNPGRQPVKLRLAKGGAAIPLGPLARLPRGSGLALTFLPYDEAAGLAGGDVAILFLRAGGADRTTQDRVCPAGVTAAERGAFAEEGNASFTSKAFRLMADRPVAAYQIFPYGGAGTHVTSATLLLPTESWGPEYYVAAPEDATGPTFAAVVAKEDGTEVSVRPPSATWNTPGWAWSPEPSSRPSPGATTVAARSPARRRSG